MGKPRSLDAVPGIRILFIPRAETARTSERTPFLFGLMNSRYPVAAVSASWDALLYNPSKARLPRLLLYAIDKVLLTLRGVILGYRSRATVVFCETAHHTVAGLVIARILGIPCVWDSHGNGRLLYESLGKGVWSVRLVTALESFLGKRVDHLITVSERDASTYVDMGVRREKIHVIPVCVNLEDVDSRSLPDRPSLGDDRPPVLLFFGSFRYEPNREGLEFVNAYLAPHLEKRGIRCEIQVAGRDIPEMPLHPTVRRLGFVPDIYASLRAATLCIVPVRRGVGALVKVMDSMAVGTPLVMFEFAAKAVPGLRHGVHGYVAATDAEFLRYVEEALSNREESLAMSRRARQLVEERFDWGSYVEPLEHILSAPQSTGIGRAPHASGSHHA
jgi:glycosyltransferase involved in cell wall biosynthesis